MKPLLNTLSLLLLALSFQAYAAKTDLSDNKAMDEKESSDFADAYTFSVPVNIGNNIQAQTFVITIDQVREFAALLDGISLPPVRKSSNKGKASDKRVETIVSNFSVLTRSLIISGEVIDSPDAIQVASVDTNASPSQPAIVTKLPTPTPAAPIVLSTPIPAAIWLFGTALLGLVAAKRRV